MAQPKHSESSARSHNHNHNLNNRNNTTPHYPQTPNAWTPNAPHNKKKTITTYNTRHNYQNRTNTHHNHNNHNNYNNHNNHQNRSMTYDSWETTPEEEYQISGLNLRTSSKTGGGGYQPVRGQSHSVADSRYNATDSDGFTLVGSYQPQQQRKSAHRRKQKHLQPNNAPPEPTSSNPPPPNDTDTEMKDESADEESTDVKKRFDPKLYNETWAKIPYLHKHDWQRSLDKLFGKDKVVETTTPTTDTKPIWFLRFKDLLALSNNNKRKAIQNAENCIKDK